MGEERERELRTPQEQVKEESWSEREIELERGRESLKQLLKKAMEVRVRNTASGKELKMRAGEIE